MGYYKLHDPKRGILGPIRLELVRELIAMGALDTSVRIARDNGPFLTRDQFTELEITIGSAPPLSHFDGDLRERTFFNVFYELFLKRATGLLSVRRANLNKDVFFEEGQPVFAASNAETERFGEFLVARGQLQRDALESALDAMNASGDSLGVTLITNGVMDEDEVIAALRDQQIMRLVDVCGWDHGDYAYIDGQRYVGDKFDLRLDAAELLVRAAREMPEVVLVSRLDAQLQRLVELSPDVSLEESEFRLSPAERGVLAQLDGHKTPAEIIAKYLDVPNRRRAALIVIYLLWEAGLLSFRDAA